ncbi:MAG: serine/threonine protein kinase [Phycisphaerales bacterium]|nr:serine/threonine protein kinase [Phycisphaerales bacterium]MCB9837122.1 serine/threonine protein kinase [Phycisphaera sp.]
MICAAGGERMEQPELRRQFELFNQLLDLPPGEREQFLQERCENNPSLTSRIRALLVSHEKAESEEPTTVRPGASASTLPSSIGGYRILSRLGEGGMGVVYAAEQARPIRRRVAIKVLKPGFDSSEVLARFDAERQALALMNHANIAQILDAGVHEGRPFFVMELIAGVPMTEYCDQRRLSIADRLRLFASVCEGVQHAHQKGIIHRDLKPSNILITEDGAGPTPKIIDFGIAKAVTNHLFEATIHTEVGRIIGTPDYMSPEQANTSALDIDTRTDVYSLGALLYELLCGTTVFGLYERTAGLDEIRRSIADATPVRPSERVMREQENARSRAASRGMSPESLSRVLAKDLDWIVHKALEKDRVRRYGSASALADDVERYLSGEVVVARPPSISYKVSKFVNRNRGGVLATAVVLLAIVAATVTSFRSAIIASRERNDAQRRADQLARVADFETERLGAVVPQDMGADIRTAILSAFPESERTSVEKALGEVNFTTVALRALEANMIDETLASIESKFAADPLIRAALLQSTATSTEKLGLAERALPPQLEALQIRRERLGANAPETIASISETAGLYKSLGKFDESEPLYTEAYHAAKANFGPQDERTLGIANEFGLLLQDLARYDEAEAKQREALDGYRRLHGENHRDYAKCLNDLGFLAQAQGDLDKSAEYFRENLDISRQILNKNDPQLLTALTNLGGVLVFQGKLDEAVPFFEEALAGFEAVAGDEHPTTMTMVSNTGYLLQELGRYDEAEIYYRRSLEARRRVLGPDHPDTLTSEVNLGNLFVERGNPSDALTLMEHVLEVRRHELSDDHPRTLNAMGNLATVYSDLGRLDEALVLVGDAVTRAKRSLPAGHSITASLLGNLSRTLLLLDRYSDAVSPGVEAYEFRLAKNGPDHPAVISAAKHLAAIYQAWNEADPDAGHDIDARKWSAQADQ